MAYREPHFDSEGAKAFYEALTQMNDNVTKDGKKSTKKSETKESETKKSTKQPANESNFYYGMGDDGWGIHDVTGPDSTTKKSDKIKGKDVTPLKGRDTKMPASYYDKRGDFKKCNGVGPDD